MRKEIGYAVVVFNQASGNPALSFTDIFHDLGEARDLADCERETTRAVGRHERHAVVAVSLVEEPE